MIWTYPSREHPRLQWAWRKVHWRRTKRFNAYIESLIREQLTEMFVREIHGGKGDLTGLSGLVDSRHLAYEDLARLRYKLPTETPPLRDIPHD